MHACTHHDAAMADTQCTHIRKIQYILRTVATLVVQKNTHKQEYRNQKSRERITNHPLSIYTLDIGLIIYIVLYTHKHTNTHLLF
jgi:hypothetical protein